MARLLLLRKSIKFDSRFKAEFSSQNGIKLRRQSFRQTSKFQTNDSEHETRAFTSPSGVQLFTSLKEKVQLLPSCQAPTVFSLAFPFLVRGASSFAPCDPFPYCIPSLAGPRALSHYLCYECQWHAFRRSPACRCADTLQVSGVYTLPSWSCLIIWRAQTAGGRSVSPGMVKNFHFSMSSRPTVESRG
jgi:hypothetical protein